MICRSCGNTYDYDYFGEENLIQAADKAVADSNFSAAKDMYLFMLEKEPSNAKALKGLILAANKVNRLYDITLKIKNGTFIPGTFNLKKYREKCDPESAQFFDKTDKIVSLYQEYTELQKTMKELESEADSNEQEINEYSGGLFYYDSADKLKRIVIGASILLVILGIFTFVFGTTAGTPAWFIAFFVIAMIITVIIILAVLLEMYSNKKEQENPVAKNLDTIDARIDETKNEMNRVIREINAVFKDMNSF